MSCGSTAPSAVGHLSAQVLRCDCSEVQRPRPSLCSLFKRHPGSSPPEAPSALQLARQPVHSMRGAVLAVVLATALVGNAAAAAAPTADSLCEAQGWNVINPEVRVPLLCSARSYKMVLAVGGPAISRAVLPPSFPHGCLQDLAPELLNLTLTAFEAQFIPSESNPDDGQRPVWVPCDQLDAQVEAACEQVGAGQSVVAVPLLW